MHRDWQQSTACQRAREQTNTIDRHGPRTKSLRDLTGAGRDGDTGTTDESSFCCTGMDQIHQSIFHRDRQTISIKPIHRACGAAFVTIPVTEYRWSHVPACRPISRPGLGRVPAGWEGPLVRYGHGGRGFSRGFGPIYIWRGLHADRSMELYGVVYQFQDLIELSRRYSIPQVYQNRLSACQEPRSLFHARRVFLEQQPIMGCPVCRQYGVLGR